MNILLDILLVLVYLSISAFLIYTIFFLRDLLKSVKSIESNISKSTENLNQVLDKAQITLNEISALSKNINIEINQISSSLEPIKESIKDYKRVKDKLVSTIEEPIDELQANVKALIKGIKVFFQTLFGRAG